MVTMLLQPYAKKSLKPEQLLRFPWDGHKAGAAPAPKMTIKERRALVRRLTNSEKQ